MMLPRSWAKPIAMPLSARKSEHEDCEGALVVWARHRVAILSSLAGLDFREIDQGRDGDEQAEMMTARIEQTVPAVHRPDLVAQTPSTRSTAVFHPDDRPGRGVEFDGCDQSNPAGECAAIDQDKRYRHGLRLPGLLL